MTHFQMVCDLAIGKHCPIGSGDKGLLFVPSLHNSSQAPRAFNPPPPQGIIADATSEQCDGRVCTISQPNQLRGPCGSHDAENQKYVTSKMLLCS